MNIISDYNNSVICANGDLRVIRIYSHCFSQTKILNLALLCFLHSSERESNIGHYVSRQTEIREKNC